MSKYNAKRTELDGITFDSKREADRYAMLKILQMAGEISDLELQPEFELIPGYVYEGKKVRAINYRADFRYRNRGQVVVEDVKGHKTMEYLLNKKMLLYKYPDMIFRES